MSRNQRFSHSLKKYTLSFSFVAITRTTGYTLCTRRLPRFPVIEYPSPLCTFDFDNPKLYHPKTNFTAIFVWNTKPHTITGTRSATPNTSPCTLRVSRRQTFSFCNSRARIRRLFLNKIHPHKRPTTTYSAKQIARKLSLAVRENFTNTLITTNTNRML